MDFIDKVKQHAQRIELIKGNLATEEATKTSLVLPFFGILGYDIFNPMEFVPEFIADVGIKKGEKVDYAIMNEEKPVILIEAKGVNDDLTKHDAQLFRYFTVTEAKFAILTNGIKYKFFTDLEETNKMDEKPFFEIDLTNISDMQVSELKKFTKDKFDINTILNTASELKYTNLIKQQLNYQLNDPSDDFVRFMINEFFTGVKTANVVEKFRPIVKKSMQQFVNDFMNDKIKIILSNQTEEQIPKSENIKEEIMTEEQVKETVLSNNKIITTEEEINGYNIVKSILAEISDPDKITYKDVESYFGVLYEGNTRKWICRLYFTSTKKSITIPDNDKKEIRYYIENMNDIYMYKDELLKSLKKYI